MIKEVADGCCHLLKVRYILMILEDYILLLKSS